VDIGVLEEDYSSELACFFPTFAIPKKKGTIKAVTDFRKLRLLLKRRISSVSYSKDWGHDPFNGRCLDKLLILSNSRLKDHILKLEMLLASLLTNGSLV
jgi:hypothetical protein